MMKNHIQSWQKNPTVIDHNGIDNRILVQGTLFSVIFSSFKGWIDFSSSSSHSDNESYLGASATDAIQAINQMIPTTPNVKKTVGQPSITK